MSAHWIRCSGPCGLLTISPVHSHTLEQSEAESIAAALEAIPAEHVDCSTCNMSVHRQRGVRSRCLQLLNVQLRKCRTQFGTAAMNKPLKTNRKQISRESCKSSRRKCRWTCSKKIVPSKYNLNSSFGKIRKKEITETLFSLWDHFLNVHLVHFTTKVQQSPYIQSGCTKYHSFKSRSMNYCLGRHWNVDVIAILKMSKKTKKNPESTPDPYLNVTGPFLTQNKSFTKFCGNPSNCFCLILLINKPSNQQTHGQGCKDKIR